MPRVLYQEIMEGIRDHLNDSCPEGYLFQTNLDQTVDQTLEYSCFGLIRFDGFRKDPQAYQSPRSPGRWGIFSILLSCPGDTDDIQEEALNEAISLVEFYTDPTGYTGHPFDREEVVRSVASGGQKGEDPQDGSLIAVVTVETLIPRGIVE